MSSDVCNPDAKHITIPLSDWWELAEERDRLMVELAEHADCIEKLGALVDEGEALMHKHDRYRRALTKAMSIIKAHWPVSHTMILRDSGIDAADLKEGE